MDDRWCEAYWSTDLVLRNGPLAPYIKYRVSYCLEEEEHDAKVRRGDAGMSRLHSLLCFNASNLPLMGNVGKIRFLWVRFIDHLVGVNESIRESDPYINYRTT